MKIGITTYHFNKRGGIENYLVELVSRLAKDNEIHIFCNDWDESYNNTAIIFHKVYMIKRPWILQVFSFFVISSIAIRKENKNGKFDIIHVNVPTMHKSDVVTAHSVHYVAEKIRKKLISPFRYLYEYIKDIKPFLIYLSKYNFYNSRKILAISKTVREELINGIGVDENKIEVIYPGVNLNRFKFNKNMKKILRDKYNISKSDIILLFAANEFKRKGIDILIRAMSKLIDKHYVKLIVLGANRDSSFTLKDVNNLIYSFNLQGKVTFYGNVDNIQEFMSLSDIFVLPVHYEPTGLVIMESMASGLIVVVSECAGYSEVIQDGFNGFKIKDSYNYEELYEKLLFIISNIEKLEYIRENAYITSCNYSWDIVADKMIKIYKSLLENKKNED